MLRPGAWRNGTGGFCSTLKNPRGLERSAVTRVLGFPTSEALLEEYRRRARHARLVVERVFYGNDEGA